jgi:hypothetical protein
MLFLVDHAGSLVFGHVVIGGELNGLGWARFLTETAEDATGEVDAEPLRIPPPGLVLGSLKRDAIDRTDRRTQITSDAPLVPRRIPRKDDASPESWREIRLLLREENGIPLPEGMPQDREEGLNEVEHLPPL